MNYTPEIADKKPKNLVLKPLWKSLPSAFIIATMQTVMSLMPGFLYLKDSSSGVNILTYMIIYLFFTEFFQQIGKNIYKRGTIIALPFFLIKLVISLAFIVLIIEQTAVQFGVIFLAYEIFQMLIFSKRFFYVDSFLYSITNAFFKGIVFNQLLTISYPFDYNFELVTPFIFSFLVILFVTIFSQGMYSFLKEHVKFFILGILCLISVNYVLLSQIYLQQMDMWRGIAFIGISLFSCLLFIKAKKAKYKEFILNVFAILSLFIYYI